MKQNSFFKAGDNHIHIILFIVSTVRLLTCCHLHLILHSRACFKWPVLNCWSIPDCTTKRGFSKCSLCVVPRRPNEALWNLSGQKVFGDVITLFGKNLLLWSRVLIMPFNKAAPVAPGQLPFLKSRQTLSLLFLGRGMIKLEEDSATPISLIIFSSRQVTDAVGL